MTDNSETIGPTFIVYLIAMLAIGLYSYQRTRDLADYILGGRRLGRWVTARFGAVAGAARQGTLP